MFNLLLLSLLFARFWQLDLKPVHHDESINGWFVANLWQNGAFQYDPTNYHGPLLFWLFQIGESLGGWGVHVYRFITVLFSVLTIWWMLRWTRQRFGLSGWWILGLLLSPGYLFFSRSAIHESVLVFFTVMAATSWIDAFFLNQPRKIVIFLYGLLGMMLLKETFVIPLGLAGLMTLPTWWRRTRWQDFAEIRGEIFFHFGVCVVLWAAMFTGFGKYPTGLKDFFVAFLPWMKTGVGGHGHDKEFLYFVKLMLQYEPASILALLVTAYGLLNRGWVRWFCAWSIAILVAYSFVPYKTPWCLISMQVPLWLSAAVVVAGQGFFLRRISQAGFVLLGLLSARTWYNLNFLPVLEPHPYIYVQSTYKAKEFAESLMRQAKERPEIRSAKIQLGTEEPWPYVWWISMYPQQGSLQATQSVDASSDLILVDAGHEDLVEKVLRGDFWKAQFPVRDSRVDAVAYLKQSMFQCPFESCQEFKQ